MSQSLCEIVTCPAIQNSLDSAFANAFWSRSIPIKLLNFDSLKIAFKRSPWLHPTSTRVPWCDLSKFNTTE